MFIICDATDLSTIMLSHSSLLGSDITWGMRISCGSSIGITAGREFGGSMPRSRVESGVCIAQLKLFPENVE